MWLSLCTAGRSGPPTSLQGPQPPPCLAHRACSRAWEPCRSASWGDPLLLLLTFYPSAWLKLVSRVLLEKSLDVGAQVVGALGPFPLLPVLPFPSLGPTLGFHGELVKSGGYGLAVLAPAPALGPCPRVCMTGVRCCSGPPLRPATPSSALCHSRPAVRAISASEWGARAGGGLAVGRSLPGLGGAQPVGQ